MASTLGRVNLTSSPSVRHEDLHQALLIFNRQVGERALSGQTCTTTT